MTTYTTNYNLDKYEGTDKPNLRDQYNSAMDKIDTELKDLADTDVQTSTNVLNLQNRMNTAESDIIDLQTADASFIQQISGINTSISSIDTRLGTAESNITDLQSASETTNSNVSALTTRVSTAESKIDTNTNDISDITLQLIQFKGNIANSESYQITIDSSINGCALSGVAYIRRNKYLRIANISHIIAIENTTGDDVNLESFKVNTTSPIIESWRPINDRSIDHSSIMLTNTNKFQSVNVGISSDGIYNVAIDLSYTLKNGELLVFFSMQPLLFTNGWGPNYYA